MASSRVPPQPLSGREGRDTELPHEMLRVPTDKRAERRRVLLDDERDFGVLERQALFHSGKQLLHGGSRQSRLIVGAGNDADTIAAREMDIQRMERHPR